MRFFTIILIAILLLACSHKNIPAVVTQTHTTLDVDSLTRLIETMVASRMNIKEKETVYVLDKTIYTVNDRGDTVSKERDRVTDRNREWQSKEAYYIRTIDSLTNIKNHVDTIDRPVPYPVTEYVEVNRLHWWQSALMWLCGIATLVLVLLLLFHKFK